MNTRVVFLEVPCTPYKGNHNPSPNPNPRPNPRPNPTPQTSFLPNEDVCDSCTSFFGLAYS